MLRKIQIEDAVLAFKNFSGREGEYNPAGQRTFCVFLDTDVGERLKGDGWNIRYLDPKDPEDAPQAYLQVKVNFANYPPKVVAVTSGSKTILLEDEVSILDWAELERVDLQIRPYDWNIGGKSGIAAYLHVMYAVIEEDPFEAKYNGVPDSAFNTMPDDEVE